MENNPVYITFEELGIVMCKANTKRKILNPIWDKMHLESVQIFYKIGYVFRDKNKPKKYYSEEELINKIQLNLEKASDKL